MNKPLTINILIERNGKIESITDYTSKEEEMVSERLSRTMSAYFTQHPEELKVLCENST